LNAAFEGSVSKDFPIVYGENTMI